MEGRKSSLFKFYLWNSFIIPSSLKYFKIVSLATSQIVGITRSHGRGPWQGFPMSLSLWSSSWAWRPPSNVAPHSALYTISFFPNIVRIRPVLHILLDVCDDLENGCINFILLLPSFNQPLIETPHVFLGLGKWLAPSSHSSIQIPPQHYILVQRDLEHHPFIWFYFSMCYNSLLLLQWTTCYHYNHHARETLIII